MGTQYDAPNQEVVGQPPPWVEGTGGQTEIPVPGQQSDGDELNDLTKDELLAQAQDIGASPANAGMTKAELIDSIRAHQEAQG